MRDILNFFPGDRKPREVQVEILRAVAKVWSRSDVIVINAPVALGKSYIGYTIARWAYHAALLTPTKMLVDQYLRDFPEFPSLKARSDYLCVRPSWPGQTCEDGSRVRHSGGRVSRRYCPSCPFKQAYDSCVRGPQILSNYYTYMAYRAYKRTAIFDEAHNIIPTLQEFASGVVLEQRPGELEGVETYQQLLEVLEEHRDLELNWSNKKERILDRFEMGENPYMLRNEIMERRGREVRGIRLLPMDIRDEPPLLWPQHRTKKIILMSATVGQKDINELGLGPERGIRTAYIEAQSPIPVERRPVVWVPLIDAGYQNLTEMQMRLLAQKVIQIARRNSRSKGVVHLTYSLADKLQRMGALAPLGSRVIWHDVDNKAAKFKEYSTTSEPKILMACGLSEGIDLVGDLGRWQVIAKVPWPSLSDPAVKEKAELDEEWYAWQALKIVMQASGRICRTPTDYGETIIIDKTFHILYSKYRYLMPEWFRQALSTRGVL